MPLISTKISLSDGHILIWRLEESVEELRKNLPDWLDLSEFQRISHPLKQREWLAGRQLFSTVCQRAGFAFQGIWKNPEGKPFLIGSDAHISLSHSEHFVAAAIHYHHPVGIDLERPRPKLRAVAHKFLSDTELREVNGNMDLLCRYWSGKEALFKLFGEKQVSFRDHIHIVPGETESDSWTARVRTPTRSGKAVLRYEEVEDYYLTIAIPV